MRLTWLKGVRVEAKRNIMISARVCVRVCIYMCVCVSTHGVAVAMVARRNRPSNVPFSASDCGSEPPSSMYRFTSAKSMKGFASREHMSDSVSILDRVRCKSVRACTRLTNWNQREAGDGGNRISDANKLARRNKQHT